MLLNINLLTGETGKHFFVIYLQIMKICFFVAADTIAYICISLFCARLVENPLNKAKYCDRETQADLMNINYSKEYFV